MRVSEHRVRTKRIGVILALLVSVAQLPEAQEYVKVNTLSTLIAMPGVAWERPLRHERLTFQLDATASFWHSVDGAPLQFLMIIPEWRLHRRSSRLGPYLGAHLGLAGFRLQKWNYRGTTLYQEGFSFLGGVSVGYKWELSPHWMLDAFVGGGNQQALYKGYDWTTGVRYDSASAWNQSAEWLPYRIGVQLGYRIR